MNIPAKDIDAYLAALPPDVRATLERLRQTIRAAAPEAEESLSYQLPTFKYRGRPLLYFGAYKNHCSLYAAGKELLKTLSVELKAFEISGSTIHFTPEHPLPVALVRKIVKARLKENAAR